MSYDIKVVKQDDKKEIHLVIICASLEFAKKIVYLIEPMAYDLIKGYQGSYYSIGAKMPYTEELENSLLNLIRPGQTTL